MGRWSRTALQSSARKRWFPFLPSLRGCFRLFCVPYAGAGALAYREFQDCLPERTDVIAIQQPGRGTRLHEPPIAEMRQLVTAIADAMSPLLGAPFGVFGHSLGATVGFELMRELRRRGLPQAQALFVSGARAPWSSRSRRNRHHLPDDDLIEMLRRLNGTPPELLEEREVLELLLPAMRADLAVSDHYEYETEEPLGAPIVAFSGSRDPLASRRSMAGWRAETRNVFVMHTLDGDHFFIHTQRTQLLALVQDFIESLDP